MKKANWLKNQDAKPLTYVLSFPEDMVAGLPWREASAVLIPLAQHRRSGGLTNVIDTVREKEKTLF